MRKVLTISIVCTALCGCAAPAGIAMVGSEAAGAGASAGIEHTMQGVAYRTFIASMPDVEAATRDALKVMSIGVTEAEDDEDYGRTLKAKTERRTVNIRFEKISDQTTQIRVDSKSSLLSHDGATSGELINQTARILGERLAEKSVNAPPRPATTAP
jgi:hypothetical protein